MKKTLWGITVIAFAALFFAGCPHDGDDDADGTFVKFKNNESFPVEVYSDSGRASLVVGLAAYEESAAIPWQSGDADFYLTYSVSIEEMEFSYNPPVAAGYRLSRVDEGKTNIITLAALDEKLSNEELNRSFTSDVYVKIQNDSDFSFKFYRGGNALKPENATSSTINDGEIVIYKVDAAPVSSYALRKDGIVDVSFPSTLTEFTVGHLYLLKYANSGFSLASDTPLTIARVLASVLPAPWNLTLSDSTLSSIALAWSAVEGAAGYNVYRSDSAKGTYAKVNSSLLTGTSYTDTGLSSNTTYYYKVSAVNGSGVTSKMSAEISATTTSLSKGYWHHDTLQSGVEQWHLFYASAYTSYTVYWNDKNDGDDTKTCDIKVSAYRGSKDGTVLFSNVDSGYSSGRSISSSSSSSYVYLKVTGISSDSSGTYAIGYASN
jgi:hypothetical protein